MAPWLALALTVGLAAPPTPIRNLGEGLERVGALEPALDPSLAAPVPPARLGARALIMTGVSLVAAGVAGMFVSPTCATRSADGGCVDARGSADVFPALVVLGLGAATTGAWWFRRDRPEAP